MVWENDSVVLFFLRLFASIIDYDYSNNYNDNKSQQQYYQQDH